MNLAWISVAALALAIILSCVTTINVGVFAIALAWIVGVYFGGMPVATVMSGFPSALFLTLAGVTLLFTMAQCNGTLDRLAHHAVRICRGHRGRGQERGRPDAARADRRQDERKEEEHDRQEARVAATEAHGALGDSLQRTVAAGHAEQLGEWRWCSPGRPRDYPLGLSEWRGPRLLRLHCNLRRPRWWEWIGRDG